jgi:para-nitrobenzyl esterase
LMGMPQTRELFHRAIVQSGSQLDGLTPDEASANAVTFLKAAEVPPTDVPRLQKLSSEQLLAALRKVTLTSGPSANFSPVVDGKFLPKAPWIPDGPPGSASVPIMIGTTATETTALIGVDDPSVFSLDDAGLRQKLVTWVPATDIDRVVAGFRKSAPQATPSDLFFAITTARRMRQQAWLQAERKVAQNAAPAWLYELDWQTPVEGGKWRSPHSLDLAFVFDNVAKSESMVGGGDAPHALSEQISAAWLAFARTGDPNNKSSPQWPQFRMPDRATMVFDAKSRAVNDFRRDERQLLGALPAYRVIR